MRQVLLRTAWLVITVVAVLGWTAASATSVGNYRVFETEVINNGDYGNKFTDVELLVDYTAPSGRTIEFRGFFDGDGKGGGDKSTGKVWKMRFMPDEVGTWKYAWRWSDGTKGGEGTFESTAQNAGKGIIKAYGDNPYWFAYNGSDPVWLKSYYGLMKIRMSPWAWVAYPGRFVTPIG